MATLILLRHGQSAWNLENRFTGEVDVELTLLGMQGARVAGIIIPKNKLHLYAMHLRLY